MVKLTELSQDEIKYICGNISPLLVRDYFQNFPKEFGKIRPGFRAEKMSDSDTMSVLVKNVNRPFISTFLEKFISDWLSQIEKHYQELEDEGFSHGEALLKTIPESVFCDDCNLYFKLTGQNYDEDYICLFRDALTLARKTAEEEKEEYPDNGEVSASEMLEEASTKIQELSAELDKSRKYGDSLKKSLQKSEEHASILQEDNESVRDRLQEAESVITDMQAELDHYRYLDRYADEGFQQDDFRQFQFVSIGQVSHDYNGQVWINRIADIVEGEVWEFYADDNEPHYFDNRDRLYWKNGPDEENAIAIWSWRADPRDTDPTKDFITCEHNRNARFTEVVEFPQCKTLADMIEVLSGGFEKNFVSEKVLFVCTTPSGTKEGLLCSPENLVCTGNKAYLSASVFMLPHYSVKPSDTIKLAGIRIHRKMNLGIPQSVFRVRTPYDAVKGMILSRVSIPILRDYDLSRKEAQGCRRFLEEIPTRTLVQELADAYACTEKEAREYVEGFIEHADTYISSTDLDMNILGKALARNSELIELCKNQLSNEWEEENADRIADARCRLEELEKSAEEKRIEAEMSLRMKNELLGEIESLRREAEEKERLAAEVEEKIAERIEEAKRNAAEFISTMAFMPSIPAPVAEHAQNVEGTLQVFESQIESEEGGTVDDIDTFEEELTENYTLTGYEEATAVEMAQAISFALCNHLPIVIGENAATVAQCLVATLGGGSLSELFVSGQNVIIENLAEKLSTAKGSGNPAVFLLHGVFDGYSLGLFNTLVNWSRGCGEDLFMLLSLEGIPVHMVPSGVWNHAVFIDGDEGLQDITGQTVHSLKLDMVFERQIDQDEYREKKKELRRFVSVLSNRQVSTYALYLSSHRLSLNDSRMVLEQMVVYARSAGLEDKLNSLFHENGITNGENLLEAYL